MGQGDYEVASNSIVKSARANPQIPVMHSSNQTVVVRNREYLGQVNSSQTFSVQGFFPINPGRDDTFPWLSQVARRFQEYTLKGMVFHYVPTSGSISSTQALGSVMMQTTYRSTDLPPTSKIEMLNEYWANEAVPYDSFCHPIECDPRENPFNVQYVRSSEVPLGDNKMMYDLGTMYIATSGQSADGVVLGDLWVTYEVELRKPLLMSNVTANASFYSASYLGASSSNFFSGTLTTSHGTLPVTLTAKTITIPVGLRGYFYIIAVLGSNAGLTNATNWSANPTVTNCTIQQILDDAEAWGDVSTTTTVTRVMFWMCAVEKLDISATATVELPNATISAGTIDYVEVRVIATDTAH
jgi:hypothetical protein